MRKPILLADDGHASLSLDYSPEHLGEETIALVMGDSGGFSSVYVSFDELKKMRDAIDSFIKKEDKE